MDALDTVPGSTTPPYRVWCIETDDVGGVADHRHVVALETAAAGERALRWPVVNVIAAIREGALFVVGGGGGGQATVLEPAVCPRCPRATLVTHPAAGLSELAACT